MGVEVGKPNEWTMNTTQASYGAHCGHPVSAPLWPRITLSTVLGVLSPKDDTRQRKSSFSHTTSNKKLLGTRGIATSNKGITPIVANSYY